MKISFLFCLLSLVSFHTHAAIVDKFKCEAEFKSAVIHQYPHINEHFDLNMVREATSYIPHVNATQAVTSKQIQIQTIRKDTFEIFMDYKYIHAFKIIDDGTIIDARLATCVNVFVIINGIKQVFSCPEITPNPYENKNNRWQSVSVKDNIPNIPVRFWKFDIDLPEGPLHIGCKKIGTF